MQRAAFEATSAAGPIREDTPPNSRGGTMKKTHSDLLRQLSAEAARLADVIERVEGELTPRGLRVPEGLGPLTPYCVDVKYIRYAAKRRRERLRRLIETLHL